MMNDIIQEALEKGVQLHAAGQPDLAAQLYQNIISRLSTGRPLKTV